MIVTGDVIGGTTLIARAAAAFVLGALGAALVVGGAAWLGTRAALRPVDRMRAAAAALPPGERLPVPVAHDELRALTEELNRLLARRDEAAARLERFTGDAAHELRSPVAAIRAQAEVAVAHPDPQMAEETLRSVAAEAVRLSSLLDDLLALARADAGSARPRSAVDLVAAAGAALARAELARRRRPTAPVVELVAPTPAVVAATPSEVALVLDNLIDNGRRYARLGGPRGGAARGAVGAAAGRGRRPGHPRGRPAARVRPVHPPAARGGWRDRASAWRWSRRWCRGGAARRPQAPPPPAAPAWRSAGPPHPPPPSESLIRRAVTTASRAFHDGESRFQTASPAFHVRRVAIVDAAGRRLIAVSPAS